MRPVAVAAGGRPTAAELADAATQGYARAFVVAACIALAASLFSLLVPLVRSGASARPAPGAEPAVAAGPDEEG